jgi:DNA-binding response OmpR family regulator
MNTILVIESNDRIRNALHDLLLAHWPHLSISIAESGPKGLHLAYQKRPDLILLDGELPGLTGFQTAKVLRHLPETHAIPLIALITNGNGNSQQITGLQQACDAFLIKPFTANQLFGVITSLHTTNGVSDKAQYVDFFLEEVG